MSSIFIAILALVFTALYFSLFPVCILLGLNTLCGWHKAALQYIQYGIRIFRFLWLLALGRSRHGIRHKVLLVMVGFYTFVFFNPQQSVSSAKEGPTVHCPDNYAYRLANGHYIRCEDFDLYHEEQSQGRMRADLYLDHIKGK